MHAAEPCLDGASPHAVRHACRDARWRAAPAAAARLDADQAGREHDAQGAHPAALHLRPLRDGAALAERGGAPARGRADAPPDRGALGEAGRR
eukprot:2996793-Prymnesium_polylepis.1